VAADNAFTPTFSWHEFGHHFAGLADEYYTSDVAFGSSTPNAPSLGAERTADAQASKVDRIAEPPNRPATPWPKIEFEKMEQDTQARRRAIRAEHRPRKKWKPCSVKERQRETAMLAAAPTPARSGPLKAPCTKPGATTAGRQQQEGSRGRGKRAEAMDI